MPAIDLTANELGRLRLMRAAVERLHREMNNAGGVEYWLSALDDVIGIANGETRRAEPVSPDGEFVEVPVTRRARVTLIGRLRWERVMHQPLFTTQDGHALAPQVGLRFVLRPFDGAAFRAGIGQVTADGHVDLSAIPSAAHGDLVYRVEPE